jgi:hypothetical protein
VRVVPKDDIRFAVTDDDGTVAQLEIRVRQDRFGGWQASALLYPLTASPIVLGRVFRSRERRLAAGKMVTWVRRRYPYAHPLAGHRSGKSHKLPRDAAGA